MELLHRKERGDPGVANAVELNHFSFAELEFRPICSESATPVFGLFKDSLGQRLFATALLLLSLQWGLSACVLLLSFQMMDGTFGIGANPTWFRLFSTWCDNRFSGVLAPLVFRPSWKTYVRRSQR